MILCFGRASDLRYQQSTAQLTRDRTIPRTVNRRQAVLSDISVCGVVAQFAAIESVAPTWAWNRRRSACGRLLTSSTAARRPDRDGERISAIYRQLIIGWRRAAPSQSYLGL